jgi:hypothetical protein
MRALAVFSQLVGLILVTIGLWWLRPYLGLLWLGIAAISIGLYIERFVVYTPPEETDAGPE